MIKYSVVIATVAGICSAMPAGAEEVGVGVGPVGVTVGEGHGDRDRDRDRDVIRDRDRQDRDKTVIINKGDHDRDDIRHWLSCRWPVPNYYFDIKDGHWSRSICVAAICFGLAPKAEAGEHSGLVHRASCTVVRYYVAKYTASAAETWARSKGATEAEIEAARRCLKATPMQTVTITTQAQGRE